MDEQTTTTTTATESTEQTQQTTTPALFDEQTSQVPEAAGGANSQENQETPPEQTPQALTIKDITIPEGYEYDNELGESFLSILNDEKISRKELAQKLFDLYQSQNVKMLEGFKVAEEAKNKKYEEDLKAEKAQWLKQCQADKEYGGQNWENSQAIIDRGCKQLATPEAVKLMQVYNLNTHPEIVRMFYRAGKLASEDNSQTAGNGGKKEIDAAMAIFGNSLKDFHKRRGDI